MSEYLIQGESMTAIADAIRAKANTTDSMTPEVMAAAIAELKTGLYELFGTPVLGEIKTGTFTVSSDSFYGSTLTLWPGGTPYQLGICFLVYTKTTNWSTTGTPPGIISSLAIIDEGYRYGNMEAGNNALLCWFGQVATGYVGNSSVLDTQYTVKLQPQSYDEGTFKPGTDSQTAVFKAGAVYEWMAWRNKE